MRRRAFLGGIAAGALAPALARADIPPILADVHLPATFRGGRPFLTLTTVDGVKILAWLDTDGSGFITRGLTNRLRLAVSAKRAALPIFRERVPLPGGDGSLPVIDDPPKSDAILAGVDVQLGGSWFAGRVWTIDYRNEQVIWHPDGRAIAADAVNPVRMIAPVGAYPIIPVIVNGQALPMALDTAASVVERNGGVVATSFITRARLAQWSTAHPEWTVRPIAPGIDAIEVSDVNVGAVQLGTVSFTTRPGDDVFEGETVSGKLGSNAWASRVLLLDYVRGIAAFD